MRAIFLRGKLCALMIALVIFGQTAANLARPGSPSSNPAGTSQVSRSRLSDRERALLQMAIQYWRGEFAAATSNLDGIIQRKPHSPDAYVWLVRVYLSQNNVDLASESVAKGLSVANSPLMHVVAGEVYFRQGLFAQAENEWTEVIDNGNEIARAYFGLSRLRRASSLCAGEGASRKGSRP